MWKLCVIALFGVTDSFIVNYKSVSYKNNLQNQPIMSYKPMEIIKSVAKTGLGTEWTYNDLLDNIKNKNVDAATITDTNNLVAIDRHYTDKIMPENLHLFKGLPQLTDNVINKLIENHINFDVYNQVQGNFFTNLPFGVKFVLFYIIGSSIFRFASRNNMMNNIPNLNKKSEIIKSDDIDVTFNDVAGCEESKFELMEVVDFLKNPKQYFDSGAKIPSGILLEGPPGTGKTLLARAVAGEAGVAFISATGSEFIEMFVGVGASRVRNLFKQARENTPAVIFIDEIDAIGRQRGTGFNSGNDEREQTLNQILTNMDGFEKSEGIIVLAATNRADILDSALTRPGRFDRKVVVPLPDKEGRVAILNIHLKNKNFDPDLDINKYSYLTSGFSGADIANMINEAAILSIRYNKTKIDNECLYDAFEKVTIGLPKKNDNRCNDTIELVAYHETGHAVIAKLFDDIYDVRKVTINANSNGAGCYTLFTQKDKYQGMPTKKVLLAQLMVSLGGRAAESLLYNTKINYISTKYNSSKIFEGVDNLDITTGASSDLNQADSICRTYINLFGFNDSLSTFDSVNQNQPFLGRDLAMNNNKISEYSKSKVDKEVNRLINYAYEKTYNILKFNIKTIEYMSELLIENTSIDEYELNKLEISYY